MLQAHERIPSRAMGRPVHLWRYGHFGPPLLVFPSAAGFAQLLFYGFLILAVIGLVIGLIRR